MMMMMHLICFVLNDVQKLVIFELSLSYFNRLRKSNFLQTDNNHFCIFVVINSVILIFDTPSSNWKHNL
jgi:hypothetical protein